MLSGKRGGRLGALALLAAVGLTACSNRIDTGTAPGAVAPTAGSNGQLTVAVVSHGNAGDPFWSIVKKGAEQAGKDLHVTVRYQGSGVPQTQAQLIDAAVNQHVSGLVVSMANPDALKPSLARARAQGIPIVTINSGEDQSKAVGAITHVGQDETIAGRAAGERLRQAGVTHAICVVHEEGNVGLAQRCTGARQGLAGQLDEVQVDVNNLAAAQSTIQAKLAADPTIGAVLTLNPAVAMSAVGAESGTGSKAKIATFDISGDVCTAIGRGGILFAVDQQPYLQGYLPVQLLKLYASNADTVGGGQPVLTGPGFVTKDNAAKVARLAQQGTR